MATQQELESALINADRAGDADSARILAAELMKLRAAPTAEQRTLASGPMRFLQGARDPVDAGAQLLVHALPDAVVGAVNRGVQSVNDAPVIGPVTKAIGMTPATTQQVDRGIADQEAALEAARRAKAGGDPGFDWMRLAGNVASPANLALSKVVPLPSGSSFLRGSAVGAAGGALSPVEDTSGGYWGKKVIQTGAGAVGGAIATPILTKIGEVVSDLVSRVVSSKQPGASADRIILAALEKEGVQAGDVPETVLQSMREQVSASLKNGKTVDPAQLLRQKAAETVDVQLTKGQLTRDPVQFARERNMRALDGAGRPLTDRFVDQNQRLAAAVRGTGTALATDEPSAGALLAQALKSYDDKLRGQVTGAYEAVRAGTGKDAEVATTALAQDYANVLDNFADKVPNGVRNAFKRYGFEGEKQTKMFTADEAEKLLRTINDNISNDPATNTALKRLGDAVKKAVTESGDDVYASARALARERFRLHDAVPALDAAATGRASEDSFVSKYVLRGDTKDVQALAKVLRESSPEAFDQAKAQIAAYLQRAAFGENAAGDKVFRPEMYAKALRSVGPGRLSAFFDGMEQAKLKAVSLTGSAINSEPVAAAVNHSNTASAAWNLGRQAGTFLRNAPVVKGLSDAAGLARDVGFVGNALAPQAAQQTPVLTPEMQKQLARLLSVGAASAGALAAPTF